MGIPQYTPRECHDHRNASTPRLPFLHNTQQGSHHVRHGLSLTLNGYAQGILDAPDEYSVPRLNSATARARARLMCIHFTRCFYPSTVWKLARCSQLGTPMNLASVLLGHPVLCVCDPGCFKGYQPTHLVVCNCTRNCTHRVSPFHGSSGYYTWSSPLTMFHSSG